MNPQTALGTFELSSTLPQRERRAAVTAASTAASSAETPALHAWPLLRVGTGIIGAGVVAVILSADHVLASPGWFSLFSLYNVLAFGGVALLG